MANKHIFSAEERRKLADKGEAMPNGSFPIRNTQDLRDAIKSWGLAKNKAKAKAWIEKRAKELGAESMLPDDWGNIEKSKDLAKLVKKKITDKRGHMQTVWVRPDMQTVGGKWKRDQMMGTEKNSPVAKRLKGTDQSGAKGALVKQYGDLMSKEWKSILQSPNSKMYQKDGAFHVYTGDKKEFSFTNNHFQAKGREKRGQVESKKKTVNQ